MHAPAICIYHTEAARPAAVNHCEPAAPPLPAPHLRVEVVHDMIAVVEGALVVGAGHAVVGEGVVRGGVGGVDEDVLRPVGLGGAGGWWGGGIGWMGGWMWMGGGGCGQALRRQLARPHSLACRNRPPSPTLPPLYLESNQMGGGEAGKQAPPPPKRHASPRAHIHADTQTPTSQHCPRPLFAPHPVSPAASPVAKHEGKGR